jgi:hypothetical protein
MWKQTLRALTLASAVSGCGDTVETRAGACGVFKPIHPTDADIDAMSDQLVEALLVHNESGAALGCWQAPAQSQ